MTSEEVRKRVGDDAGTTERNQFGWDFRSRILATPEVREFRDDQGQPWLLWLVLRERDDGECYEVVYDADENEFGLAYAGSVVGWYGSFLDAINSM